MYVNFRLAKFVYLLDVISSVYDKVITEQPVSNIFWKVVATIYSNHLFSSFESVRMIWNIGDNRNLFLKLKTKFGCIMLNLEVKTLPKKIRLTLVETQQLLVIEKVDSKEETSC